MMLKKRTICPNCGGELIDESIGWKCEKCRGFISFADGKFYEHQEKPFMPPMTNADRIRTMNDGALKDFICDLHYDCCECTYESNDGCKLSEWLKQPAGEED